MASYSQLKSVSGGSGSTSSNSNVSVVLPAPTTVPTTSWFGNSYSGNTAQTMQIDIDAFFVAPDGTAFTNSYWSEGGLEAGIYKNGSNLAFAAGMQGYGRVGGYAVTADTNYMYLSMTQNGCDGGNTLMNSNGLAQYPPCNTAAQNGVTTWWVIRRFDHSGNPAPFASGYGYDGAMLLINSLTTTGQPSASIVQNGIAHGLAVGNGMLFVADSSSNTIKVFNSQTLMPITSWSVNAPGSMVYDSTGYIWIAQAGGLIQRYSIAGVLQSQQITVDDPTGLAIDPRGRLYVSDNGPDQNVKIYDDIESAPALVATLGVQGGVHAAPTPGLLGDLKFNGPTGVGIDSSGNVYVAQNGTGVQRDSGFESNTEIRALSPNAAPLWNLYANEYVNGAVVDPTTDGNDIYTTYMHYKMDYTQPVGQQGTADQATMDRFLYPQDPRNHIGSGFLHPLALRWISGNKFLFMTSMYAAGIQIFRFDDVIAVPSVIMTSDPLEDSSGNLWPSNQPTTNQGIWIWRDANGNGLMDENEYSLGDPQGTGMYAWWVDLNGDVWQGTLQGARKFAFRGLDASGNPIYSLATSTLYSVLGNFTAIQRLIYIVTTDTMYVSGYTNGATDDGCWGAVGKTLSRIDNFTTANPHVTWTANLPFTCSTGQIPKSMDVAGNAVFIVDSSNGGNYQGLLRVYDATTGSPTISFYPGAEIGGATGLGWADIPYALHAFERASGQYMVFVEDDLHGKIVNYSW